MKIKLLSGALGAEISGIDLKDSSKENFQKINNLLLEHKVIFLEIKILHIKNILPWLKIGDL